MAIIHHTTLQPSKLDLLTEWLPGRPWYRGGSDATPVLVKSGGFRLDDPEGEVGIEFMVATDTSAPEDPVAYFAALTYRAAPLEGAEHALIGTMEHGVLGKRWAYDACHDPVAVAELLALLEGKAQAMAQSISDTLDDEVVHSYSGAPFPPAPDGSGLAPAPVDDRDGTRLTTPLGTVFHVHRVLRPVPGRTPPAPEDGTIGHIARSWQTPDGEQAAAVFMTVRAA